MLQGEHSAILSTFIKLPYVIKIFVLSIFEWPLKTGFITVFICAENIWVFFLHLLHIFKCTSDFFMEANNMRHDQDALLGAL